MKAKTLWVLALAVCAALTLAVAASADTLTLKDGRVIKGKYIGGTAEAIQMEVNGTVRSYNMNDVVSVTRDPNPPPAPPVLITSGSETDMVPAPPPALPAAPAPTAAVAPATVPGVTVPAGARILIRMVDGIDSEKNHVGDHFRATLEANLEQDGAVLLRRGADVYGQLSSVQGAGRLAGHAELRLELTGILVNDNLVPITTGDYQLAGE